MARLEPINFKKLILIPILVLLAFSGSAESFRDPSTEGSPLRHDEINVSIVNRTDLETPVLRYRKNGDTQFEECDLDEELKCSLTPEQGVYNFYFIDKDIEDSRFPSEGFINFAFGEGNETIKNMAEEYTNTDPSNEEFVKNNESMGGFGASCEPWENDYTCRFEHMQSAMISSFANAYTVTGNETYKDKASNLNVLYDGDYNGTHVERVDGHMATCEIYEGDFYCENESAQQEEEAVSSTHRQYSLVNSLLTSGSLLSEQEMLNSGENYTLGQPENMKVWEGDLRAENLEKQGKALKGFWEAYIRTGNKTFREKALEIAEESINFLEETEEVSKPFSLVEGFSKTYSLTENTTFYDKAIELTGEIGDKCIEENENSSCGITNHTRALKSFLNSYKYTGNYYFLRFSKDLIETEFYDLCNPWEGDFECPRAHMQGKMGESFWMYHRMFRSDGSLSSYEFTGDFKSGSSHEIILDIDGFMEPSMELRAGKDSWNYFEIPRDNKIILGRNDLLRQTVYSYRFINDEKEFPVDGSFKRILMHGDDDLIPNAEEMTEFGVNHSEELENYSFGEEDYKAKMIKGFSKAEKINGEEEYVDLLTEISNAGIGRPGSPCDHTEGDFNCDTSTTFSGNGSYFQGLMIGSMWNSYRQTRDPQIREIALNYTEGSADDCDVWDQEFECDSERGQGYLIKGYLDAYKNTNNQTYLEIAENLAETVTEVNNSVLAESMWKISGITNKSSYRDLAEQNTFELLEACLNTDDSCNPIDINNAFQLGLEAYRQTVDEDYLHKSMEVSKANNSVEGFDVWEEEYETDNPEYIGSTIELAWGTQAHSKVDLGGEITVNVSSKKIEPGDDISMSCKIENTVSDGSILISPNLTAVIDGFSTDKNLTYFSEEDLEYEDSINSTWELSSEDVGEYEIGCIGESENDWADIRTVEVTVEEEEEPTTGNGNGGNGGTAAPTPDPDPEFEVLYENYSLNRVQEEISSLINKITSLNVSITGILETEDIDIDLAYTDQNKECISGVRSYDEETSESWLNISYECPEYLEKIVIYDEIPLNHTSFEITQKDGNNIFLNTYPSELVFTDQNFTRGEFNILYEFEEDLEFEKLNEPIVIMKEHKEGLVLEEPEKVDVSFNKPEELSNYTKSFIEFDTLINKTENVECDLKMNNDIIYSDLGSFEGFNKSLESGWNYFKVECTDREELHVSESFSVYRLEDEQDPEIASFLWYMLLFAIIISLSGSAYSNRKELIFRYHKNKLKLHKSRFKAYNNKNDIKGTLKSFEKVRNEYKKIHGKYPDNAFWIDLIDNLSLSFRLYLLMDMTSRYLDMNKLESVSEKIDNLNNLYKSVKNRKEDDKGFKLIENKAENVNKKLEKAGISKRLET